MDTVRQMIIAAGGFGSRMSKHLNPLRSKALIKFQGKPLLFYVLDLAKKAGIEEFFISVNPENGPMIEAVARDAGVKACLKLTGSCFAQVPSLFKQELDRRFIVTCGHDPIPVGHLKSMLAAAKDHECVTTAYANATNSTDNRRRVILTQGKLDSALRFELVDLSHSDIGTDHTYVRNPYIITRSIVEAVERDGFRRTAGYHIFKYWWQSGSVTCVPASMPVEFDHDHEWERTKRFLQSYLGTKNAAST